MSFSEWKETSWGEIATLEYGKALRSYKDDKGNIPVYGTNGKIGFTDQALCNSEGVIIGRKGAYRGVHYSSKPFFVIDTAFYLKGKNKKEFINKWAYYELLTKNINSMDSGSAIPSTSRVDFYALTVNIPPLPEQKAIADTLSCLDDKIELNKRINKTLEEMAQTIFKSWFVDFEPFQEGKFEDSELGRIPKGWRKRELGELVEIINGYSYKGSELKESEVAMMSIKNFDRNGGLKIDGFKEIEISERVKGRHYLNIFDVLVACTDLTQNAEIIGNPILVLTKSKYINLIASMDLVKVVPKVSSISNFFLYTLMKNEKFKQFALGYTSGTTVLHLNKKAISEYKFALPKEERILKDFSCIVEPLFKLVGNNINENRFLTIIRDSLLPKLMSGEIRIPISS